MTDTTTKKYNVSASKKPGSVIEIAGSLSPEDVERKRDAAIKKIGADIELPGFRKGHVPKNMIESRVGELLIYEEAAGMVLESIVPEILAQESVPLIAFPKVRITKLAPGNPVEFVIAVYVMPEVTLPDYMKVAKKAGEEKEVVTVTDKEVEEALMNVRKTVSEWKKRKAGTPENASQETKEKTKETAEPPPLSDEDVKMIGDYKDLADFTEKLKLSLKEDKERKVKDKRRGIIAEALIKETKTDPPDIMVEEEKEMMLARFKHDIEHMGAKFDEYLKSIGKTADDLKKEWEESARKRVILELAFAKIAKEEKLEAPKDELEREVKHYLEAVKDAEPDRVRAHITRLLINEEVFKKLENA